MIKKIINSFSYTHYFVLDSTEAATSLYEELLQEFPDHTVIHTSYLQSLDPMEPKRQLPVFKKEHTINIDDVNKIITICDTAVKSINQESLLAYFAVKNDPRPESSKIKA